MLISSGSLTGCDSAAGNMGKETTGVEYEEADYELSEESSSDSGIDAADPGTVDNETEKTAENRTDAEKSTETEESSDRIMTALGHLENTSNRMLKSITTILELIQTTQDQGCTG